MVKIWRNRIEAGTQRLSDCPKRYRNGVVELIRSDLADCIISEADLQRLVNDGMMTEEEYEEITGEPFLTGEEDV